MVKFPDLGDFFSVSCVLYPCYMSGLGLSPNGQWATFFAVDYDPGIKIVSVDGTKKWEIYFTDISGYDCRPCGEVFVLIEHWSLDGNYLYLRSVAGGDGGGNDWFWDNDPELVRFELATGTWVDTEMGRAAIFSPNDQYLVYRADNEVRVTDLGNGVESIFVVPDEFIEFGHFVWSPDNTRIIFAASTYNLDIEDPSSTTLFLIDLGANTIEVEYETLNFLWPEAWDETGAVQLVEGYYEGKTFLYYVTTNELIPLSP